MKKNVNNNILVGSKIVHILSLCDMPTTTSVGTINNILQHDFNKKISVDESSIDSVNYIIEVVGNRRVDVIYSLFNDMLELLQNIKISFAFK